MKKDRKTEIEIIGILRIGTGIVITLLLVTILLLLGAFATVNYFDEIDKNMAVEELGELSGMIL